MTTKPVRILLGTFALAVLGALELAAAPYYRIEDLTPDGYSTSVAYDVNAHGDAVGVAGRFDTGSLEEAFFYYDHSAGASTVFGVGTVTPRGSIVGSGFARAAINDDGQIAGSAKFVGGSPQVRGFIYSGGAAGTFTNLGVLAGATATGIRPASDALDINNSGLATGTASSGAGTIGTESDNIDIYVGSAAPITDIDGDITALTRGDYGRSINDAGVIAGSNQDGKATLFNAAAETVLLTGTTFADEASWAVDLNEAGQVAGSTAASSKAFIYDSSDASVTVLPQIGTGNRMDAKAINEHGDVVGKGDRGSGLSAQARGYVYLADDAASYILEDQVVDLTLPTVPGLGDWERLRTAWGINDDGWIVGQGDRRFAGGTFPTNRAYLLIPVPEPSGDVNDDGLYRGVDFLEWQRGYPADNSPLDLADWGANFGSPAALPALTAVPEPSTWLLAAVASLLASRRRR